MGYNCVKNEICLCARGSHEKRFSGARGRGTKSKKEEKMKVELSERDIVRILQWAESATKGSYTTIEDGTLLTVEEDILIRKLEGALKGQGSGK